MSSGTVVLGIEMMPFWPSPWDLSWYNYLGMSWFGSNSGSTVRFKFMEGMNYREGLIEDTYSGHRQEEFNLKTLGGSIQFNWREVDKFLLEFSVMGEFHLDKIELFGAPRVHCSLVVRNTSFKNLSVEVGLQKSIQLPASLRISKGTITKVLSCSLTLRSLHRDLSSSAFIVTPSTIDLSSSLISRGSQSKDLPCDLFVFQLGTTNLSCYFSVGRSASQDSPSIELVVRNADVRDLSSDVRVVEPVDLSCSLLPRFSASRDISSSLVVKNKSTRSLSCSLNGRRPITHVKIEEEISGVAEEYIVV